MIRDTKIGVLAMAYGGPNTLDEIPGYLADIRSGRVTGKRIVDEITKNYIAIGGKSPLYEATVAQSEALGRMLGPQYRVYVGMRHWSPWIEDTVRTMLEEGVTHIIGIVFAPHQSRVSIDAYHARVQSALSMYHSSIPYMRVHKYHTHPDFILSLANAVRAQEATSAHLVMTAHSIPKHYEENGGTYAVQLNETAEAVAASLGLTPNEWSFSFQSKGRSQEEWLGPNLEEHLTALKERGIANVTVLPIGFVTDHVEILYDIDIKAQEHARSIGLVLGRARTVGHDELFIKALCDTVISHAIEQNL